MRECLLSAAPPLGSHGQHPGEEVDYGAAVVLGEVLFFDNIFDDFFLSLQKLGEPALAADHLEEQDAAGPHILLVGVEPVVGLGRGEERVLPDDAILHLLGADAEGLSEADQLDEVALALVHFEDHEVFGVDGLVRVAELVAELEGEEDLAEDVDDVLEAAQVLVVVEFLEGLAGDVLEHDVEEVVLAEVLDDLHDIGVVQVF